MGKVIKILLSLLSAAILTAIIVPVAVSLLLCLPSVQNFAAREAAGWLGRKLETPVAVEQVHLRLFNRVTLEGLYVEDYHGDTLLYVPRLTAALNRLELSSGRVALGGVSLEGPRFYLMQDSTMTSNLRQVLSRLKRKKPKREKRPFLLTASSVEISDMTFRHRKFVRKGRDGVDFTDLAVDHFYLKTRGLSVVGDSVTLAIRQIALRDKSGFQIDDFSAQRFSISGSGMYFDGLEISLPDSHVEMKYLRFLTGTWKGYNDFLRRVKIEAELNDSRVSFRSIAYFAPSLRSWQTVLDGVTGTVSGPVADMQGRIARARTRDTEIGVRFSMRGVPDIRNTHFTFDVFRLRTSAEDVRFIAEDITGRTFSPGLEKSLYRLGNIHFRGRFDGLLSRFRADGRFRTVLGEAAVDFAVAPAADGQKAFRGDMRVNRFDVGTLSGSRKLGRATVQARLDGTFGQDELTVKTDAGLSLLEFNDYAYGGIVLDGTVRNRMFRGLIRSDDPNLQFDFDGLLDFNDTVPRYDFDLRMHMADLHALNFNRRDSISVVQGRLTAHAGGASLDDVNGEAVIRDLLYVNPVDSVRTGEIRLVGENGPDSKSLAWYSPFADVTFRGRSSYDRMFGYFTNTLRYYLPTLSAGKRRTDLFPDRDGATNVDDYYVVKLDVKQANNVAGIFLPGLQLAEGTKLSFLFNPQAEQFSLSLNSDYIERGDFFVSGLSVNSRNQGDSISLYVGAEDLFAGGFYMPDFSVIGGAKQNRVNLGARFSDPEQGTSALLGVVSALERDSLSGRPRVRIRFTPSSFTTGGRTWRIGARSIVYDADRVAIRRFRITSQGQELGVDGVASRDREDTLHLNLSNFDLTPFSQLSERMGYHVRGITNGHADMVSVLGEGLMYAYVNFDSVRVNDVAVPPAVFESRWDFHAERAKFTLMRRQSSDTLMVGYYRPTDRRYRADFDLKGLDLSLLDPLLSGVVRDTRGSADAALMVTGVRRNVSLNGTIRIPELSTTVDFTNVPYRLRDGEIVVKDNVFTLTPAWLTDPGGNRASMEMSLDMNHLANLSYDLKVQPENMLVLNTTSRENELFNGTVYASGGARIRGDKRGTNMTIAATTSDNSSFFMSLDGTSNISQADFVVFENPNRVRSDSLSAVELRKLRFKRERRRRNPFRSSLDIDMSLNVRPNTDFRLVIDPEMGNGIRARGNGALNLHVNPTKDEFTMLGDYEITEGSYNFVLQNIINKTFTIQPGSAIRWTGDPADALLDITAAYKLKASLAPLLSSDDENFRRSVPVECDIKLAERLRQPAITFDVRVQNVDPETQNLVANALNTQEMMATQFFWLLAVNSFYSDNTGSNQSLNIGAMGGSATGFEFLSSQLSNWISSDRYNIGIRYRPKSDLTSDELELGLSTGLFDNRLLLEMEGNYDFGNNAAMTNRQGTSNLTGDFYLTWLIDRAGNLRTKAFTRTIDRFDENQGLQESGIGIYYKEDFNSFKDILRNIRERFRRKKNKEKFVTSPGETSESEKQEHKTE